MKKIVFVVPNFDCGGAERVSVTFAKQLLRAGNRVEFVNIGDEVGAMRQWLEPDIPFVCLKQTRVAVAFKELGKYLYASKPDYVYSSRHHVTILLLLLSLVLWRLRVVVRIPTMPTNRLERKSTVKLWGLRMMMKWLYRRAYWVIAQTEAMKEEVIKYYRIRASRIVVIPNPIDKEMINVQAAAPTPYETALNFLAVGNVSYAKAYDVLIEAFRKVLQHRPEAYLYILGRHDSAYAAEIMASATSCQEHIRFLGFQSNPYVYMRHCSVFVLSSRMEGCPNVLLEANYLNKRLVATQCVPIVEQVVHNGVNGYIVPVDDSQALADAMLKACDLAEGIHNTVSDNCCAIVKLFR